MRLSHKPIPGKPGFRTTFRHPLKDKKLVCLSLGTHDENEAARICRDGAFIFNDAELLKDDRSPRLLAFHPRAVALVFGDEAAEKLFAKQEHPPLVEKDEIGRLVTRILAIVDRVTPAKRRHMLEEMMNAFESRRYKELQEQFKKLENEVMVARPRIEDLELSLHRYRRKENEHVKVLIGEARDVWTEEYKKDRVPHTVMQATGALAALIQTLPNREQFKLAEVDSDHIDSWIVAAKGAGGQELSPITRRKLRAYVSSFFTWATRRYKLSENPMQRTAPVAGVQRHPEHIIAIRRLKDLQDFIQGLEDAPYWQAWCAVACFAGPRWSEQQWLKLDDIYLDEGYLRIASRASGRKILGTKTGRERNVPIEKTVLLPILKKHISRRRAEQKNRKRTTAEASPWLFPSTVPESEFQEREKTQPGQWSHGRTFLRAWAATVEKVKGFKFEAFTGETEAERVDWEQRRTKAQAAWLEKIGGHWNYGPAEWRHTFGTMLGQCGWTSLEISRAMGNSPQIAERHYVAVTEAGKRWPFKW